MTYTEEKAMAKLENIGNWMADIQEELGTLQYDPEGLTFHDLNTLEGIECSLAAIFKQLEDINKGL